MTNRMNTYRWLTALVLCLTSICANKLARAESTLITPPPQVITNTTIANLPACSAVNAGAIYRVTNALAPTIGLAVAAGGAITVLVDCNGSNWLVGV